MPNVAAYLCGQVLLWRVRLIFRVVPAGDFVATHGVPVSQRSRQEVNKYAGGQNCRRYGALDAPLLARVDLVVSRHSAPTRPEDIVATLANGKKRTYRRVIEPRKEDVSPRHARRRRAQAKEEVACMFHIDPGFASAVMDNVCRRARASGGVALSPTAAVSALPLRL